MTETAVYPSDCVQFDRFLNPAEQQRLFEFTLQREPEFVATSTTTNSQDYRRSRVLYRFPEFYNLMVRRIREVLPEVLAQLEITPFAIAQIEAQLTAHNDGHYYKLHNDNGSAETANRVLSYVYYFCREPQPFSGGELIVYDSRIENNFYVKADSYRAIEPRNNRIVFFRSRYLHEVLPIRCPSRQFADSRFTINGWIRQD